MLRFSVFVLFIVVTFAQTVYGGTHTHILHIEGIDEPLRHQHPNSPHPRSDEHEHTHMNIEVTHSHHVGEDDGGHTHPELTLQVSGLGESDAHDHHYKYVSLDGDSDTDDTSNGVTNPTVNPNPTTGNPNPTTVNPNPTNPSTGNSSTNNPVTSPDTAQASPTGTGVPESDNSNEFGDYTSPPGLPVPPVPIEVTEYMVRDWSLHRGGGLPQWIELYNPNADPVSLDGWTFQYATRKFANHPFKIEDVLISEATIAPESALIFVTRQAHLPTDSTLEDSQVYDLQTANVLKRGWKIITTDDEVIHQIGEAFDSAGGPIIPPHQEGARVSHHVIESEDPSEPYYYGAEGDIGSPGFHEPVIPAAPALIRPKKIGVWADLKRRVQK